MRIARVTVPGMVHHVICRFIDKDWLITSDDEREQYLWLLGRALTKTDWTCLAYVVMSSHVHLALVAGEQRSERWSRRVNPPFVNWLNERHDRIGPAFAGRASMWIQRAQNVGELIAYIHNNPVRAGVVGRAAESTWSSHRAFIGSAPRPAWLDVDGALALAGVAGAAFDSWVHGERAAVIDESNLVPLRDAARTLGAIELGTPVRDPLEVPLVARPYAWLRPSPARVVAVTAAVCGFELAHVAGGRSSEYADARAIAVALGCSFGLSMSSTAAALGISPQAASRLAMRCLDERARARLQIAREHIERDARIELKKEKASPRRRVKLLKSGG